MTFKLRACTLALTLGLIPSIMTAEEGSIWVKKKDVTVTKDGEAKKTKFHSKEKRLRKEGERTSEKDVTITKDDGEVIKRKRDHSVKVDRNKEDDTISWIRRTEVKESTGRSKVIEAEGEAYVDDEGVRHFEIDRDGQRVTKNGEHKSWHEDVEGTRKANEIGGKDTEAETVRTKDDGSKVTEDMQRRTRTNEDKNAKAYIEQKVITDEEGKKKVVQKEGCTVRRYQKHGYSDLKHSQGKTKKGVKWNRQERVDVRYNDDGSRTRIEASVTSSPGEKPRVVIKKGTYTKKGKGWMYKGIVQVRQGSKVIEEKEVTEVVERTPFPSEQPTEED